MKNKTIELRKNGVIFHDKYNHRIEMTFVNVENSKVKKLNNNYLYVKEFNGLDDIEVSIKNDNVKENIYVYEPRDNYRYQYLLLLTNVLIERIDNQIIFVDKDTHETVCMLKDMIMYDDNHKESTHIKIKIKEITEDIIALDIIPSKRWMNSQIRKYPIIIDPSLETISDNDLITITSSHDEQVLVGIKNKSSYTLSIDVNTSKLINEITSQSLSTYKAYLEFYYESDESKDNSIYKITCGNKEIDYQLNTTHKMRIELNKLCTDLTSVESLSLTIKHYDIDNKDSINNDYLIIKLDDYEYRPRLVLEYLTLNDLSFELKELSLNEGGSCYVDIKKGRFTHKVTVGTIKENALSMNLELILSSMLLHSQGDDEDNKKMTKGWRTNFHQYIKRKNKYNGINETKEILYIDGNGDTHLLKDNWYYIENNKRHYVSEDDITYNSRHEICYSNKVLHHEYTSDEGLVYLPNQGTYNLDQKVTKTYQKNIISN